MTIWRIHTALTNNLQKSDAMVPLFARFLFAAILLPYFWVSGLTKLGDGFLGFLLPSVGAYAQIFPKAFEAAAYDTSALGVFHWAVAVAGTWSEFLLPLFIVIGFMARLSALGMIGFIIVQSLTDLYGHGGIAHAQTLGAWFDKNPGGLILDQRGLWVFLLFVITIKGAGAFSVDRVLDQRIGHSKEASPTFPK